MAYFLYGLFFVSCIVLVAAVLLQPGKTDAGALFTSNISSTAYTPRGAQTVLSKLTIIAATTFMLSALLLSMPALTGNISVLQTTGDTPGETSPVVESNSNTNVDVNQPADANAGETTNSSVEVPENPPAGNGTANPKPATENAEEEGIEKSADQPAKNEK